MLGGKSNDQWISEYSQSHQHPINRFCHTVGIPLIAVSIVLFLLEPFVGGIWKIALVMFVAGWIFQFVGHFVEGKPPEFFKDWRFLFVGLRWWFAKIRGRA
jgi:uncharacterized membrane protein YGL010W